jgi:hypothetical protein
MKPLNNKNSFYYSRNKLTKQGALATACAACWRRFEPADHFIFGPFPIISFNNELVKTPFSSFELKITFY